MSLKLSRILSFSAVIFFISPIVIQAQDADQDQLSDYFETYLSLTNPNLADSDANGTLDSAEDFDSDELNNLDEQAAGMNPPFRSWMDVVTHTGQYSPVEVIMPLVEADQHITLRHGSKLKSKLKLKTQIEAKPALVRG